LIYQSGSNRRRREPAYGDPDRIADSPGATRVAASNISLHPKELSQTGNTLDLVIQERFLPVLRRPSCELASHLRDRSRFILTATEIL